MAKKLKKLEPKHHRAIRLRVEGKTNKEIAKAVGSRVNTVNAWFADPLVKEELDHTQENVKAIFEEKMATRGLQALDAMGDMMGMPLSEKGANEERKYLTFEERLQIIDRFLERNPNTQIASVNGETGGAEGYGALPPEIMAQLTVFKNMNSTELIGALGQIVGKRGAVELPAPAADKKS